MKLFKVMNGLFAIGIAEEQIQPNNFTEYDMRQLERGRKNKNKRTTTLAPTTNIKMTTIAATTSLETTTVNEPTVVFTNERLTTVDSTTYSSISPFIPDPTTTSTTTTLQTSAMRITTVVTPTLKTTTQNAYGLNRPDIYSTMMPDDGEIVTTSENVVQIALFYSTQNSMTTETNPNNKLNNHIFSNNDKLNDNDAIEAANYAANNDADFDSMADSQQTGLECWSCDSSNWKDCAKNGRVVNCRQNEITCTMEIRKRGSEIFQISMSCKDELSCQNQKDNNFQGARPQHYQCKAGKNLDFEGPSVCRQCCNVSFCSGNEDENGKFWMPETTDDWTNKWTDNVFDNVTSVHQDVTNLNNLYIDGYGYHLKN